MLPLLMTALCDEVEVFTGGAASSGLPHVRAGYARVLQGLIPGRDYCHAWNFLRPYAEISISQAVTGTATGVYDASTYTVVTATTAIFDVSHVGDTITITDIGDKTIATYTSSTILSFAGDDSFAGKAVSIQHPGVYALPDAFSGLVEPFRYAYESTETGPIIQEATPGDIQDYRRGSHTTGDPRYYAIVPAAEDQDAVQGYNLWVWPRPDATRIWTYRYIVSPTDVSDAAKYFLGAPMTNQAIRYAALADAEVHIGRKPGHYERLYNEAMLAAVGEDRRLSTRRPLSTVGR